MDTRVAKRYARALFGASKAHGIIASVDDDLNGICGVIASSDKLRQIIYGPDVPREDKMALLERLFSDRVTALTMQVVRLLLEKRRENELEFIRLEFNELRRKHENIIFAKITSAYEIDDDSRQRIIKKISESTGKSVEAVFDIDARLVGGIKVAYDNYVLDGSVRGHLDRLKELLRYEVLKQG